MISYLSLDSIKALTFLGGKRGETPQGEDVMFLLEMYVCLANHNSIYLRVSKRKRNLDG